MRFCDCVTIEMDLVQLASHLLHIPSRARKPLRHALDSPACSSKAFSTCYQIEKMISFPHQSSIQGAGHFSTSKRHRRLELHSYRSPSKPTTSVRAFSTNCDCQPSISSNHWLLIFGDLSRLVCVLQIGRNASRRLRI